MGTRGTVGFIIDNERKSSYQQYDSYPSGVGLDVLAFVRQIADPESGVSRALVDALARELRVVPENGKPTADDLKLIGDVYHQNVSSGDDWYSYLRSTQGKPALILDSGYATGHDLFGSEVYDYVINLDSDVLVVYKYGKQIAAYPFTALPTDEVMAELG